MNCKIFRITLFLSLDVWQIDLTFLLETMSAGAGSYKQL